jgi:FSR family fosmidomycin resistance protein-like MFS transporter
MSAASPVAPASLRADATVISLVGFAHGTSHFYHFVLPPLFPYLMAQFGLSFTQAGALMTTFFVVSGIGQALAGFVVDRFGALRVLYGGMGLLACSGLVLASAGTYAWLMVAAAVAGLGNSVFHPADYTLINRRVSTPRLGHAFSVHGLSGSLGWALAPVFVLALAEAWSWRAAGVGAALVGFAALGLIFANRGRLAVAPLPADSPQHPGGSFAFLRAGVIWMCFLFFLLTVMAFGGLQNFAPPILERTYGVTLAAATTALTAYLLGNAAGIAAGGFLASKGERQERLIAAALGFGALCALLIASGWVAGWSIAALMALMGFGVGLAGPSRDMLVRRATTSTFGARAFGRIYGFVYSGIDTGLAIAPIAFGLLMDAGRFAEVLWGVAALQVLAIAAAVAVSLRARASAGAST